MARINSYPKMGLIIMIVTNAFLVLYYKRLNLIRRILRTTNQDVLISTCLYLIIKYCACDHYHTVGKYGGTATLRFHVEWC